MTMVTISLHCATDDDLVLRFACVTIGFTLHYSVTLTMVHRSIKVKTAFNQIEDPSNKVKKNLAACTPVHV